MHIKYLTDLYEFQTLRNVNNIWCDTNTIRISTK